jgi:hypothetical protein
MLQTVKDHVSSIQKAIDYILSDHIGNLDDVVSHDPKSLEAFTSQAA